MSFPSWFWDFWNWPSDIIRFKGYNDPISSRREVVLFYGIIWHWQYAKYHHGVFFLINHFGEARIKEAVYLIFWNPFGKLTISWDWLVAPIVAKVEKERDELRDSNSHFKFCINDLKLSRCALKQTLISGSGRAEIAESQRISSCSWLNYNSSWISSFSGWLMLQWEP